MRLAAGLLLLGAAAWAGGADDLLVRARHAQLVLGDLDAAIKLYSEALKDTSLTPALQAGTHVRLAICYVETKQPDLAKGHLAKGLYEREGVPSAVRLRAAELRDSIKEREPKPVREPVKRPDEAELRARRLRARKRQARAFLRSGDVAQASYHIQAALELAPDDEEVRALAAELETRLSGVMDFLSAPLQFLSRWTASRTRAVAREAQDLLRQALIHSGKRQINVAERYFREAIQTIDACEFADNADELIDLRLAIHERWRSMSRKHGRADPVLPTKPRRATLLGEHLGVLQRMLDLVSSPEREYRIVPVAARRVPKETRGRVVPRRFTLFDHLPSRWTPALFASQYLRLRVHPASWRERGNYLEAAGGMLITRNHPKVLDSLQKAVRRIERPETGRIDARFMVVSVTREALAAMAGQFGAFAPAERGESPLLYRVIPKSLDYLSSFLRDENTDVKPERDTFEAAVANGVGRTLFVGVPLSRAPGYEEASPAGAPVTTTHYGLHLDAFPLRERDGRTAVALRVTARYPAAPLLGAVRFLSQQGELFVDLAPNTTLAVTGIVDPFAAGAGKPGRELLLLWHNPGTKGAPKRGGKQSAPGIEIPLRNLLLKVRDQPGPRSREETGFARRDRLEVLRERARFLEALLREGLRSEAVRVDVEAAVARIPPLLREEAARLVAQLEGESARSYVVRVLARSVRTRVFERWLKLEQPPLLPFGSASVAMMDGASGEFVLRRLEPFELDEVFAPQKSWPAITVLGLQAGHALHARTRTSPAYATDEDLAGGETRTVTEGTRVTIRPYSWGNRLKAWVEVELAGLQSEVEEVSLSRAVPSYRTRVAGTRVTGLVDFGEAARPKTAIVCRIPHPTASSTDTLMEIVIALSIRPLS